MAVREPAEEWSSATVAVATVDVATVAAIGIIAYALTAVTHEVVGHGLACVALGGEALAVTSTELRCDQLAGPPSTVVTAAGSVANVLVGLATLTLALRRPPTDARLLHFAWIVGTWNLFHAGSYLIVGALFGWGDWGRLSNEIGIGIAGPIIIGIAGAAIVYVGQRLAAGSAWQPLLGLGEERSHRWPRLTWPALAGGFAVSLAAGLLSPLRPEYALVSSLAAPLTLLWLARMPHWPSADAPRPALPIRRSPAWLAAGLIGATAFVLILGPGIGSFVGYPIAA